MCVHMILKFSIMYWDVVCDIENILPPNNLQQKYQQIINTIQLEKLIPTITLLKIP